MSLLAKKQNILKTLFRNIYSPECHDGVQADRYNMQNFFIRETNTGNRLKETDLGTGSGKQTWENTRIQGYQKLSKTKKRKH